MGKKRAKSGAGAVRPAKKATKKKPAASRRERTRELWTDAESIGGPEDYAELAAGILRLAPGPLPLEVECKAKRGGGYRLSLRGAERRWTADLPANSDWIATEPLVRALDEALAGVGSPLRVEAGSGPGQEAVFRLVTPPAPVERGPAASDDLPENEPPAGVLELLAYLRHPAATARTSAPAGPRDLSAWVDGLERFGREACVRGTIAAARPALGAWTARFPKLTGVSQALEAVESWAAAPTPRAVARIEAALEQGEGAIERAEEQGCPDRLLDAAEAVLGAVHELLAASREEGAGLASVALIETIERVGEALRDKARPRAAVEAELATWALERWREGKPLAGVGAATEAKAKAKAPARARAQPKGGRRG